MNGEYGVGAGLTFLEVILGSVIERGFLSSILVGRSPYSLIASLEQQLLPMIVWRDNLKKKEINLKNWNLFMEYVFQLQTYKSYRIMKSIYLI